MKAKVQADQTAGWPPDPQRKPGTYLQLLDLGGGPDLPLLGLGPPPCRLAILLTLVPIRARVVVLTDRGWTRELC